MSTRTAPSEGAVHRVLRAAGGTSGFPIKGWIDCSLLDWPGKLATVLFLPGCNFRCPFCHNHPIVLSPGEVPDQPFDEILSRCRRQADWIDGVVVSGGEPTIHSWLPDLLRRIREEGFSVKLDTNGSHPRKLADLIGEGLVDFVAMDLKAPLEAGMYGIMAGTPVNIEDIRRSIEVIISSGVPHAFRTTVVPNLFTDDHLRALANTLPRRSAFSLQNFQPENALDPSWRSLKGFTEEEFMCMSRTVESHRAMLPTDPPVHASLFDPVVGEADSCLAATASGNR